MEGGEKNRDKYRVGGADLSKIRNRNERRVISHLPDILADYPDFEPDLVAIQDIYALALNQLPARYTQRFSIVLQDPVSDEAIRQAVREAVVRVMNNPTDQDEGGGPVQW